MTDQLRKAIAIVGGQTALARAIGLQQPHVWYWLNKGCPVPAEHCAAIERATEGKVSRHDLRPDLFGPAEPPVVKRDPGAEADQSAAALDPMPADPDPAARDRVGPQLVATDERPAEAGSTDPGSPGQNSPPQSLLVVGGLR